MALKGVEYSMEYREHLLPGLDFSYPGPQAHAVELFFSFYIVATGLHAIHVAVGIIALIVIGARAREGGYSDIYHSPVTVAALYWHFVDMVWIFLFALIYLPGRSG
jgi:cytochrome c oxidase subunit 3